MSEVVLRWLMVDWDVWFTRSLVLAFSSPLIACLLLDIAMRRHKGRQFDMLRPIFIAIGIGGIINVYQMFQLPLSVDLNTVPTVMWVRIARELLLAAAIWRFTLYIRGILN